MPEPKDSARGILSLSLNSPIPEWVKVLPAGKVILADDREPFLVDQEGMAQVVDAWKARGNDLVFDYEHQTLDGVQAPAAGWIKELVAKTDGIWARVEWTDKAKEYIGAKEYRYYSPVVALDSKTRRVKALLHVALTNFPAIRNLPALAARYGLEDLEVISLGATDSDKAAQEKRSKEYGIGSKDKGNVTKPSEFADVPDALWADPVNYSYPMKDWEHTKAAWAYWNQGGNQEAYTTEEQRIITERIKRRGKTLGRELQSSQEGTKAMLKQLIEILGLKEDTTETTVLLALADLKKKADGVNQITLQLKEATDKLTATETRVKYLETVVGKASVPMTVTQAVGLESGATAEQVIGRIEAYKAGEIAGKSAQEELVTLKRKNAEEKAEALRLQAINEGKTSPEELARDNNVLHDLALKDPAMFETIILKRPKYSVIPKDKLDVLKEQKSDMTLTEEDREMCRQVGVTEEAYLKTKNELTKAANQ